MEELIKLLVVFRDSLLSLKKVYVEFILVMDEEEDLISRYDLVTLEQVITRKDQLLQRAQNIENRRVQVLEKISYLIAYNSRGNKPTLREFREVFARYLQNVETLIDADTWQKVKNEYGKLCAVCDDFVIFYKTVEARSYRNKKVVKDVLVNISRSVRLCEQASDLSMQYDNVGKTKNIRENVEKNSSLRVRV